HQGSAAAPRRLDLYRPREPQAPNPPVNHEIDDQDQNPQGDLEMARKRSQVNHGQKIVLDKIGLIASLPALATKPILKRRQWALPPCEFDERCPRRSRHVEPGDALPFK